MGLGGSVAKKKIYIYIWLEIIMEVLVENKHLFVLQYVLGQGLLG